VAGNAIVGSLPAAGYLDRIFHCDLISVEDDVTLQRAFPVETL
jgi:hypothetical protein